MKFRESHIRYKIRHLSNLYDRNLTYLIKSKKYDYRPPLFICGSGRNGSTLISSILNNHDNVFIPPENSIIPFAIKFFLFNKLYRWNYKVEKIITELKKPSKWKLNIDELEDQLKSLPKNRQNVNYLINHIYFFYAKHHSKNNALIWGDKTPSNTVFSLIMKKQFAGSKVLFMIRDPRDVINSLLKINYEYYIEILDFKIWIWKNSVAKYKEISEKYPKDILLLPYEEFVVAPEKKMHQIINWLDLQENKLIIDGKESNMDILGVQDANHHQQIRENISGKSINNWNIELDTNIVQKIELALKNEMIDFNYELSNNYH